MTILDPTNDAARILSFGGLVAFPTETVYGLGADAENPAAVAAIYQAKGRPNNHPVIVHLAPEADLNYWASAIPKEAQQLIAAFWPGPLTLILKRASHIPDTVSGGQDSIGLRCPSHPVALALLRAFKHGQGGIAAPSANKFGRISPTTAQHVRDEFCEELKPGGLIAMVLEGQQSQVGIESTIVDLSRLASHGPVLLRPGQLSLAQLTDVLGRVPATPLTDNDAPRASGSLLSHYAPRTPLAVVAADQLQAVLVQLAEKHIQVALLHDEKLSGKVNAAIVLPFDADIYARELYASLRLLDLQGADVIIVLAPPGGPAWQGINDRLRRAAHDSLAVLAQLMR